MANERTDVDAVLLANGSVRIKRTRHGLMAYNINDLYVGRSFDCYGEFSRGETQLFAQLIAPQTLVVDIGANIGAHTIFLAHAVGPRGLVFAIEPQRVVFQLLCANLALNEVNNVRAIRAGAGRARGQAFIPVFDYAKPGNFGGIGLSESSGEPVELVSIDSLQLPACHFMKIDVEGHEQAVIAGAVETISRFRPTLYVENDRQHQSAELIRQLRDLDYTLYWHLPPLFRADNFFQNPTNVFANTVSVDMLCLPSGDARKVEGLRQVSGPDDWPLAN
jgi:FkbM family methyltransferase